MGLIIDLNMSPLCKTCSCSAKCSCDVFVAVYLKARKELELVTDGKINRFKDVMCKFVQIQPPRVSKECVFYIEQRSMDVCFIFSAEN